MSELGNVEVLIVEDDDQVRDVLHKFISKIKGYKALHFAESLSMSKLIIEKEKPGLILLDVYLADGKGVDLLQWVRSHNYNTDIIMITADKQQATFEMAMRYGAIDYLIKPFQFTRLQEAVDKLNKRRENLNSKTDLDQATIDNISNHPGVSPVLNQYSQNKTYNLIMEFLEKNEQQGFTSNEVAENLGISRITARKYLEMMENSDHISIELDYGTIGRPKNKYFYISQEKRGDKS